MHPHRRRAIRQKRIRRKISSAVIMRFVPPLYMRKWRRLCMWLELPIRNITLQYILAAWLCSSRINPLSPPMSPLSLIVQLYPETCILWTSTLRAVVLSRQQLYVSGLPPCLLSCPSCCLSSFPSSCPWYSLPFCLAVCPALPEGSGSAAAAACMRKYEAMSDSLCLCL